MVKRLGILNIWVDHISKDECLKKVEQYIETDEQKVHVILASNPEKNFSIPKYPSAYNLYKTADILLPDGIGIVLAARVLHGVSMKRLPGADVFSWICSLAAYRGYRVFIFGAKEHVNKKAVAILRKRYPNLRIVGRSHGYVSDDEMHLILEKVNQSKAEILFIALGSPKQENWIASYGNLLEYVKVCQGIGGTLDTIAGNVKRAPERWQKLQLEWLYRLLKEPKRIKRQKVLPIFAIQVLKEKIRRVKVSG